MGKPHRTDGRQSGGLHFQISLGKVGGREAPLMHLVAD